MEDEISKIFVKAESGDSAYTGMDGWYELHTPTLRKEFEALLHKEAVKSRIDLLIDILEIPSKYIDDGTMVYWADFQASTLEEIIKGHIIKLQAELDKL